MWFVWVWWHLMKNPETSLQSCLKYDDRNMCDYGNIFIWHILKYWVLCRTHGPEIESSASYHIVIQGQCLSAWIRFQTGAQTASWGSVTHSKQSAIFALFHLTWVPRCPKLSSVALIDRWESFAVPSTQRQFTCIALLVWIWSVSLSGFKLFLSDFWGPFIHLNLVISIL